MNSSQQQRSRTNRDVHQNIIIRAIRPTDVAMKAEFVRRLSSKSRHFRFLGGVKALTPNMLNRFCNVDFEQSAAFVAIVNEAGKEVEIGVARYAPAVLDDVREMAVTVADEWQDKGVGALLVQQLIDLAKRHGVTSLYCVELAGNSQMRELANELGMSVRRDPDDSRQIIYTLTL